MADPTIYGDPDKMTSSYYYLGTADNAGVHQNAGVGNKAMYLLTDGGSFNGYTITGLGLAKVAAIYYDVQTKYLVSGSDYQDLGDALYFACRNMIGRTPYNSTIITNNDCQQVYNATHAVEMHLPPHNMGLYLDLPYCENGVTTPVDVLFNETFDGGLTNWVTSGTAVSRSSGTRTDSSWRYRQPQAQAPQSRTYRPATGGEGYEERTAAAASDVASVPQGHVQAPERKQLGRRSVLALSSMRTRRSNGTLSRGTRRGNGFSGKKGRRDPDFPNPVGG